MTSKEDEILRIALQLQADEEQFWEERFKRFRPSVFGGIDIYLLPNELQPVAEGDR
jgi:hypothetical protein